MAGKALLFFFNFDENLYRRSYYLTGGCELDMVQATQPCAVCERLALLVFSVPQNDDGHDGPP